MTNVKHTTNNGEILTTNCKRVSTALRRFAAFLNDYDSYYNDMLNNINSATDNNTTTFTDDRYNTVTMTLTVNDNNDNYTLTIKHTHNDTNDTTSDTPETVNNDTNETAETDNNEESDTNDTKDTTDTNNDTDNTNETTETTNNINNIFESIGNKQLIRAYVDGINNGLENDNYKQTRECFEKVVQILPDGYEICFTTRINIDMTKVDEPIYNHRYRIIRDKTGLMFTIHKYSEVQHKYIPLKPETEISDIIRYIYFRTFDSVCLVFKHDSTLEIITKLEKLFDTVDKYKNCYLWHGDNGNISVREYKEKRDAIDEIEWYDNGDKYTAEFTVKYTRNNVYTKGIYTKNGKQTTLAAIKNSYNRLLQAIQRE